MPNSLESLTNADLVAACLDGRQSAWEELVRRYSNFVYAIIWKNIHKWRMEIDLVQDLYQKVWLKILQPEKLRQLQDRTKLQSWIGVITSGECIDFLRSKKRHDSLDAESPFDIEDVRLKAVMAVCIERLSHEQCRKLILSIYYEGLTHREAADAFSMPLGSVSKMLRENIVELKELLENLGFFEE